MVLHSTSTMVPSTPAAATMLAASTSATAAALHVPVATLGDVAGDLRAWRAADRDGTAARLSAGGRPTRNTDDPDGVTVMAAAGNNVYVFTHPSQRYTTDNVGRTRGPSVRTGVGGRHTAATSVNGRRCNTREPSALSSTRWVSHTARE